MFRFEVIKDWLLIRNSRNVLACIVLCITSQHLAYKERKQFGLKRITKKINRLLIMFYLIHIITSLKFFIKGPYLNNTIDIKNKKILI